MPMLNLQMVGLVFKLRHSSAIAHHNTPKMIFTAILAYLNLVILNRYTEKVEKVILKDNA